ncbi:hypothetical protein ACHAQA_009078 [Verticillium albo-atrum]
MSRLNPYAEQHKAENLAGPGDSRPTALQIIKDQDLVGKWAGRVAIVTGCSPGGIGIETARALHVAGADVYIGVRDVEKGNAAAVDILSDGKPGQIKVLQMDLGSLASVRQAAESFLSQSDKLHVLVNNAGIMACPEGKTADGFETQLGTNHLGHFYLFHLLKSTLLSSTTPEFASRVISVSSSGHFLGGINLDDLNFEKTPYHPWLAYAQSKLANIHFANELDRRYDSQGLHALSLMPGGIQTGLLRHIEDPSSVITPEMKNQQKNTEQGAATTVWAAVAKELEGRGGVYLDNLAEALPSDVAMPSLADSIYKVGRAYDPPTEGKLWEASLKLVGLEDDRV